jgi:shikimate kinase
VVAFEDRNIVLTGFMGTGKSTIGRRLAKTLGFAWVDTDRIIEERHGTIPEIFARAGETIFRGIERNLAAELSSRTRHVVSTGGRMLLDPDNIRAFSTGGRIFCLTADPDVLVSRLLKSPTPRPLLAGKDPESDIRALLAERQRGYARFVRIDSSEREPDEVVVELAELIGAETATATGRKGVAVLGDALTGLPHPVIVVTDAGLGDLHSPCVGAVERVTLDPEDVEDAAGVIYLGGSSVTTHIPSRPRLPTVAAPTTPRSMDAVYPNGVRVIADLATLQTLPSSR